MSRDVFVTGVGMIPFTKPGANEPYPQMAAEATRRALADARHDCFAQNKLISYEALGLCPAGGAEAFVCDGDNTYGGKVVTNPSGGLLSKGHPLGATGLAQCTELVAQLRGTAQRRQVDGARLALQHNLGLGGDYNTEVNDVGRGASAPPRPPINPDRE